MDRNKITFLEWFIVYASFIVLVVAVYNSYVRIATSTKRVEGVSYNQTIADGVKIRQINNQLINALAKISAQSNDQDIKAVLESEGVTFTVNSTTGKE